MAGDAGGYYLVKGEALPTVLKRTLEAKELLRTGRCRTVREAVQQVGLSRSAFYKYRHGVEVLEEDRGLRAVTLSLLLSHHSGVLSRVLGAIASARGNVRTINQNQPVSGMAPVTVTFESNALDRSLESLLEEIRQLDGVVKVEMVGEGAEVGN